MPNKVGEKIDPSPHAPVKKIITTSFVLNIVVKLTPFLIFPYMLIIIPVYGNVILIFIINTACIVYKSAVQK